MLNNISRVLFTTLILTLSQHAFAVGPSPSQDIEEALNKGHSYPHLRTQTKINIAIPVFDPNVPEDPDDFEKLGVWPEIRNTEAKLFALRLRDSLQASQGFGAVRVVPNDESTAELYVTGKILESTSENIALEIAVKDISQRDWFRGGERKFEYRVREYDLNNPRTSNQDPYAPIFAEITQAIIDRLARFKERDLVRLKNVSSLVLARSYSDNEFGSYLKTKRSGLVQVNELPAAGDPKYQRVLRLRTREEVFVDELQDHYQVFAGQVGESYAAWQRDSFPEAKEYRLEKAKARRDRRLGILSAVAGAVLATEAGENDVARAGAIAGGVVGGGLIFRSFRTNENAKIHREKLTENGQTLDLELAPQNVEFEGKTLELTGTAAEQFQQHREFLEAWYDSEATPEVQL